MSHTLHDSEGLLLVLIPSGSFKLVRTGYFKLFKGIACLGEYYQRTPSSFHRFCMPRTCSSTVFPGGEVGVGELRHREIWFSRVKPLSFPTLHATRCRLFSQFYVFFLYCKRKAVILHFCSERTRNKQHALVSWVNISAPQHFWVPSLIPPSWGRTLWVLLTLLTACLFTCWSSQRAVSPLRTGNVSCCISRA